MNKKTFINIILVLVFVSFSFFVMSSVSAGCNTPDGRDGDCGDFNPPGSQGGSFTFFYVSIDLIRAVLGNGVGAGGGFSNDFCDDFPNDPACQEGDDGDDDDGDGYAGSEFNGDEGDGDGEGGNDGVG